MGMYCLFKKKVVFPYKYGKMWIETDTSVQVNGEIINTWRFLGKHKCYEYHSAIRYFPETTKCANYLTI